MTKCYKRSVQCLIYIRDILLARILFKTQDFTNEKMKIFAFQKKREKRRKRESKQMYRTNISICLNVGIR